MGKNILQDLKDLNRELIDEWVEMQKRHRSHELYQEFIENQKRRDPYTSLAVDVGRYSGITYVQNKIKEVIDKYDK
ncbi:MAG: hypothetical protein E7200_04875 [Selenomonas ruminantium]|nr:hypothetical protein [Selenomonas ruminantium]